MRNLLLKLNRLSLAVLFLLCLPFMASAQSWTLVVDGQDTPIPVSESKVGVATFEVKSPITSVTVKNDWGQIYAPEEAIPLGQKVRCSPNGKDVTFASALTPGSYNVEITQIPYSWGGLEFLDLVFTRNDGSIDRFEYSLDGNEWTGVKPAAFTLAKAKRQAGSNFYLRQTLKAADDAADQTTYTYYYGGTISGISEDATETVNLTMSTTQVPVTFNEEGIYSVDKLTLSADKKNASISVNRFGNHPLIDGYNLKIAINGGTPELAANWSNWELPSGATVSFTDNAHFEGAEVAETNLYPVETVILSSGSNLTLKLSTNPRYSSNKIKAYIGGKLTVQSATRDADDETSMTLTYNFEIDNAYNLPQVMLFNKNTEPKNTISSWEGNMNATYYSASEALKTVKLRSEGGLIYSGMIALTEDDIANGGLTFAESENWPNVRGYMFVTGTNNIAVRGKEMSMAFPEPLGQGAQKNGLLEFGNTFTPGIYRVTVEAMAFDSNKPDYQLPVTVIFERAATTYYHVDGTTWREVVGLGMVRKFGYTEAEAEAMGLLNEYQSKNLYLCTDHVLDNGEHNAVYYTGSVDFPDDETGTVYAKLTPTDDANAAIAINGKGQFQMNFDPETAVLTMKRTDIYPVPVRAEVSLGDAAEGDANYRHIIPVGGKYTVHVTEPGTALHFSATYDTAVSASDDANHVLGDPNGEWIHPEGNLVFGDAETETGSFSRFNSHDEATGNVTAAQAGYYTFSARVYPVIKKVMITCDFTPYDPSLTLSRDFSDAAFGKYPYVKSPGAPIEVDKNGTSSSFKMRMLTSYILRGDAVKHHNEFYKDDASMQLEPLVPLEADKYNTKYEYDPITGEKLRELGSYERGELVRGNRYLMEAVEDLFGPGGIIGANMPTGADPANPNFVNLVNLYREGLATPQGRLEAAGGRISFVVQWASSSRGNRMGYFYVTPSMRQRILDQYRNSEMVKRLSTFESFEGIGDDESKSDYLDGVYTKCLIAALGDGVIPGFGVLGDASNRGAVKYLESQSLTPGKSEYYVNGTGIELGNLLGNEAKIPYYHKDRCWIEGARIPLSYFGEDYRGEMSENFPEGTYIYPYIISSNSNDVSCWALPLGGPGEEDKANTSAIESTYTQAEIKFSDNRLNLVSTLNGRTWDAAELANPHAQELVELLGNHGCPAAITFNYQMKNLNGENDNMTLVGWEDLRSTIGSNWQDLVLNVDGVKPFSTETITLVDFDVEARPVSTTDKKSKNDYEHIISLHPVETTLGNEGWTMHQFGTPYANCVDGNWEVDPIYSYIDVTRDGKFIGQIIFEKGFCLLMLKDTNPDNPVLDTDLHTSLRYFFTTERMMKVDGMNIEFIDASFKPAFTDSRWIEIFHESRGNGHKPVDISRVKFVDQFPHDFGDSEHSYAGVFYSSSALIDAAPDKVLVPESALTMSLEANNELPGDEMKFTPTLPEVLDTEAGKPAIMVARDLNLANKEVIESYSIFDLAQAETPVATVTATAADAADDGSIAATAWMLGETPLEVKNLDEKSALVYVDGLESGRDYTVAVNTRVTMAADEDYALECSYDNLSKTKFDVKASDKNIYGAPSALIDDINSVLTLEIENPNSGNLRKIDDRMAVSYETHPSWSIDLSKFPGVEPEDVRYFLWRQYKSGNRFDFGDSHLNEMHLSTQHGVESFPGSIPADSYNSWNWAPTDIELNNNSLTDLLLTKFVDNYPAETQLLEVEYNLYAYIPVKEEAEKVMARGYGEQTPNTRYYVARATKTVMSNQLDVTTGIEDVTGNDNISVTAANGTLTVTGAERVNVYSISGAMVFAADGDVVTTLPAGVYLVKADGKIVKINI